MQNYLEDIRWYHNCWS